MDIGLLNSINGSSGAGSNAKAATDTQDRFLKLLVAQMQNQDPMNPMDNAQVTSQMAQIQTVTGVEGLRSSIKELATQFGQLQALQGISLVGRDVTLPGNTLMVEDIAGSKQAQGAYELSGAASRVKLEVLSPAGAVLDTVELGAQSAGLHDFSWSASKGAGYDKLNFRITATNGAAGVSSSTFSIDKVQAVATKDGKLQLQLEDLGLVDYRQIQRVD